MPRTFSHIPDPHFVQKSKEADEGGGGSGLPPVTSADNGKMLQVNDGDWVVKDYPYTIDETTLVDQSYDMDMESEETLIDTFTGNFSQLTVIVNDQELLYDPDYTSYHPEDETTPEVYLSDGAIKIYVDAGGTYHVKISQEGIVFDEKFEEGVNALVGSGGGSGTLLVTCLQRDTWYIVVDKNFDEVIAAVKAGKMLIFMDEGRYSPCSVVVYDGDSGAEVTVMKGYDTDMYLLSGNNPDEWNIPD